MEIEPQPTPEPAREQMQMQSAPSAARPDKAADVVAEAQARWEADCWLLFYKTPSYSQCDEQERAYIQGNKREIRRQQQAEIDDTSEVIEQRE